MTQLFSPRFQAVDANGNPYSGAKLYFYSSGTTTPITVYQDVGKLTPHTNPVVADSTGTFAAIFVDTDPYKVVLKTSADVVISTADAIPLVQTGSQDADLTALALLSTTGMMARIAANTYALRTITAGAAITVTNGNAVSGNPTIAVDVATAANFRANLADKVLDTDAVWSAAAEVTLTDATTIVVDMSTFINAVVTLTGNRTLGQPSSVKVGQSGVIRIMQDATGSRTLSYHADWEFAGGTAPTLSTAAGSKDLLFYQVLASGSIYAALSRGVA